VPIETGVLSSGLSCRRLGATESLIDSPEAGSSFFSAGSVCPAARGVVNATIFPLLCTGRTYFVLGEGEGLLQTSNPWNLTSICQDRDPPKKGQWNSYCSSMGGGGGEAED